MSKPNQTIQIFPKSIPHLLKPTSLPTHLLITAQQTHQSIMPSSTT